MRDIWLIVLYIVGRVPLSVMAVDVTLGQNLLNRLPPLADCLVNTSVLPFYRPKERHVNIMKIAQRTIRCFIFGFMCLSTF